MKINKYLLFIVFAFWGIFSHSQFSRDANGVTVVDHRADEGYVTPEEVAGEDDVYISRIRKDPSVKNGIAFWCVGDNLRKGAALNTVQIAELLVSKKIKGVPL